MTRKKVKLAFISNDAARKATFKKRKKGLLKKVTELSTLCGIDACAIIFSPFSAQPELWPSAVGVQRVLAHFRTMPEMEQTKKMVNQESFLRHRIAKAADQLKRHQRENREKEMTRLMFQSLVAGGLPPPGLSMVDLNDLGWVVDQKVVDVCKRMELLAKATAVAAVDQTPYVPAAEPPWVMEMVSQRDDDQMGFNVGGDDVILPFGDENHGGFWSNNGFFP